MGKNTLSAGRVQSPALKLLVDREKEIEAFVPEEFWLVKGLFQGDNTPLQINNSSETELKDSDQTLLDGGVYLQLNKYQSKKLDKFKSYEEVKNIQDHITSDRSYVVSDLVSKTLTTRPKAPFTTSTLQQAASSKLGYVPKATMGLAQKLYEGVDIDGNPTALITYMRTDSVSLSDDAVKDIRDLIGKEYPNSLPSSPNKYTSKSKNAQEAHEAIRPTNVNLKPDSLRSKLTPELFKLYDLIWRHTVACQMTDEKRESVTIELTNTNEVMFSGSVSWTVLPGYKVMFPDLIQSKPDNLNIVKGEKLNLNKLNLFQKFTQPPSRFSQATLIKVLEELGIGRPSTYASIISTLHDREYVEKGAQMKPTLLGMKIAELLDKLLPTLTSASLTAMLEDRLDAIANGKEDYITTLKYFWMPLKEKVEAEMLNTAEIRKEFSTIKTDEKCPTCQSEMDLKLGRFGDYFQCKTTVEHKFAKNYREYNVAIEQARSDYAAQIIGKNCEECGDPLIVRVSKSTLNPYIACAKYTVGNKHSIQSVNFGPCPQCQENKREGVLVKRKGFRGSSFVGCSLDKTVCGYVVKKVENVES